MRLVALQPHRDALVFLGTKLVDCLLELCSAGDSAPVLLLLRGCSWFISAWPGSLSSSLKKAWFVLEEPLAMPTQAVGCASAEQRKFTRSASLAS